MYSFQITFEDERWISGIITQGMALNIERRVDSFIVEYQNISGDYYIVGHDNRVSICHLHQVTKK